MGIHIDFTISHSLIYYRQKVRLVHFTFLMSIYTVTDSLSHKGHILCIMSSHIAILTCIILQYPTWFNVPRWLFGTQLCLTPFQIILNLIRKLFPIPLHFLFSDHNQIGKVLTQISRNIFMCQDMEKKHPLPIFHLHEKYDYLWFTLTYKNCFSEIRCCKE